MMDYPATWLGLAVVILTIVAGLLDRREGKERERREQKKLDDIVRDDAVDSLDPNKLHNRAGRK